MTKVLQDFVQRVGESLTHWKAQAIPGICWLWPWQTSWPCNRTPPAWPTGWPACPWLGAAGHGAHLYREIWPGHCTNLPHPGSLSHLFNKLGGYVHICWEGSNVLFVRMWKELLFGATDS